MLASSIWFCNSLGNEKCVKNIIGKKEQIMGDRRTRMGVAP